MTKKHDFSFNKKHNSSWSNYSQSKMPQELKPKRPRGLKQATLDQESIKKQKLDDPVLDNEQQDTATLAVQLDEEEDDFKELCLMHDHVVNFEGSVDELVPLLNGVVHECDRMLRLRDAIEEQQVEDLKNEKKPEINAMFYYIYAHALLALAEKKLDMVSALPETEENDEQFVQDVDDVMAYLDACLERIESGKELVQADDTVIDKFAVLSAKTTLIKAKLVDDNGEQNELLDSTLKTYASIDKKHVEDRFMLLDIFLETAEMFPQRQQELLGFVLKCYQEEQSSEDEGHLEAMLGLGNANLALCNHYGAMIEDEQEENDETDQTKVKIMMEYAESSVSLFRKALKVIEDKKTDPHYILRRLGEALIQNGVAQEYAMIGSSEQDDDLAEPFYREAFEHFVKVHQYDPEDEFVAGMLEQWKEEFSQ